MTLICPDKTAISWSQSAICLQLNGVKLAIAQFVIILWLIVINLWKCCCLLQICFHLHTQKFPFTISIHNPARTSQEFRNSSINSYRVNIGQNLGLLMNYLHFFQITMTFKYMMNVYEQTMNIIRIKPVGNQHCRLWLIATFCQHVYIYKLVIICKYLPRQTPKLLFCMCSFTHFLNFKVSITAFG